MRNPRVLCNIATRPRACACIFHKTLGLMLYLLHTVEPLYNEVFAIIHRGPLLRGCYVHNCSFETWAQLGFLQRWLLRGFPFYVLMLQTPGMYVSIHMCYDNKRCYMYKQSLHKVALTLSSLSICLALDTEA